MESLSGLLVAYANFHLSGTVFIPQCRVTSRRDLLSTHVNASVYTIYQRSVQYF